MAQGRKKEKDSRAILRNYAEYFSDDNVVLFPTDTVPGIGCRFDSAAAIARIRQIKGIVDKAPLAVLISDLAQLELLKVRRSRLSNLLMEKLWPGGLTIVLTSEESFPCSGEANSLGIRMPDVDLLRRIIEIVGAPLAATSANFHNQPAPRTIDAVDKGLLKQIDHVIKLDLLPCGRASTVVKIEGGLLKFIRQGAITENEIREIIEGRD